MLIDQLKAINKLCWVAWLCEIPLTGIYLLCLVIMHVILNGKLNVNKSLMKWFWSK